MNPSSTASCYQSQSLSFASNSPNVVNQGTIWQINIAQTYGSPVRLDSVRVDTQGQLISETVLLTLIDANQQQTGPFTSSMNTGSPLIFQNLPPTPIQILQIQFPAGTQTGYYMIIIMVCPQTNTPLSASILLFF